MKWHLIIWLWAASLYSQQTPSLPYQPAQMMDQKGHEWFIESNGGLQRSSGTPTMIGNCLMLQVGTQQFYGQQSLISPDGSELLIGNPQPVNGLKTTRRITFFEREGALRYVEEFQNTTHRDLTANVEVRHSFNQGAGLIYSDAGRELKGDLEVAESGVICLPDGNAAQTPALYFMMRSPGSKAAMRLMMKGNYQLSVSYILTVPAGQTQSIIHGVSQLKIAEKATPAEVIKASQSYSLKRLSKGLPKAQLRNLVNFSSQLELKDLRDWFPSTFWGITEVNADQLALGEDSLLQGEAGADSVALSRGTGKVKLDWARLSALAGPMQTGDSTGWLWLRDGQRWRGVLETPGLHLTLISGSKVPVQKLDRLVLAKPTTPSDLSQTLIELQSGERIAIKPEGDFQGELEFGKLSVPWSNILMFQGEVSEKSGGMLFLEDGSLVHVLPSKGQVSLATADLGTQKIELSELRHIVTPKMKNRAEALEQEPATAHIELTGGQRLIARVTDAELTFKTAADPVTIAADSVRELTIEEKGDASAAPRFRADLWAGGHITGHFSVTHLQVEGSSFRGKIPVAMIQRLINPIPTTNSALMSRMGQMIQNLGDAQWKVRETATNTLRGLGLVAKGSLQEALKTSTDAEVTRRLEELLQDLE